MEMKELLEHDEEVVRFAALQIHDLIIDSDITSDELTELTEDILELIVIEKSVSSVERKILLEKAYKALKFVVVTAVSVL